MSFIYPSKMTCPCLISLGNSSLNLVKSYHPDLQKYFKPTNEGKIPSSEEQKLSIEGKIPSSEEQKPSTEEQIPMTEEQIPMTEEQKPSSEWVRPPREVPGWLETAFF
jgi:hypothetical protein